MRKAEVYVHGQLAGWLTELNNRHYRFVYDEPYRGSPVSLTMPLKEKVFEYDNFPAFFDGLLPEGSMLEALLRQAKLDKDDYFSQLVIVGSDLVGAVTVKECTS